MGKFTYQRKKILFEAYGQVFDLPPKTPALLEKVRVVGEILADPQAKVQKQIQALLEGISLLLGQELVETQFPNKEEIDTDELSALWLALADEYERSANEMMKKYSPSRLDGR